MSDVAESELKLNLSDERLWRGDQLVRISNKAFQLLRLFADNPNQLLTKDVILDEVWGDISVTEGLIKEYVHDLRAALGDDPNSPQFIETVRGRGYRFLGGIEIAGQTSTQYDPSPTATPSLAVIPFINLTGEERWGLFCHGLSDDLVIDLARYPDLQVIANSIEQTQPSGGPDLRDTGRQLGAGFLLNGSVQASESNLRINVKLVETAGGNHVWTEQYEREHGDLFEIQSDIVSHVASAVGGFSGQIPKAERKRLGRKPPNDLEAYELYLLGYELELPFEKDSTLRGVELMRRAVELDPQFARAWLVLAWLAWQILLEDWADDREEYWRLTRVAFTKAATLDPLDPFAVMELASVRAVDGDITGARDSLIRALDLGRNEAELMIVASTYASYLIGDQALANSLLKKGLRTVVNTSPYHHLSITRVSYFAKDFERAINNAKHCPDSLMPRLFEILSLAQLGRMDDVQELRDAFNARFPKFDPESFMKALPITATGAKHLFLDGIEKSELNGKPSRLRAGA